MNDATCNELKELLGERVRFDMETCRAYDHDLGEMPGLLMAQINPLPEAVVAPRSLSDVVTTVAVARDSLTPITPRGQASSGFGGAIPTRGGIVLDLSSMNTILSVDTSRMTVDVEPGVVWQTLSKELKRHGMDNRICPTSAPSATVGGWFCMGGVGIGSLRYGSVADVVEEIEVVGLDGAARTCSGAGMDLYYQTCGTLGIVTRLRLKCRRHETIVPFAALLQDAQAVQSFVHRVTAELKPETIILHSEGYAKLREAAGGGHSIPQGNFLAIVGVADEGAGERIAAMVSDAGGELLPAETAREEWEDRFYPMRIKKVGPTVLVSEFYLPVKNFADAWAKIARDLRRDEIGMEALVISRDELAVLVYLPECSRDLLYPIRMAKAVRPERIAHRYGGRPYTAGLWFAAEAENVLGSRKLAEYLRRKKESDPHGLLNPGKIVAPQMRWMPLLNIGKMVQLGSRLASPLALFLTYRRKKLSIPANGAPHEH